MALVSLHDLHNKKGVRILTGPIAADEELKEVLLVRAATARANYPSQPLVL